jgi:hypothetical protein
VKNTTDLLNAKHCTLCLVYFIVLLKSGKYDRISIKVASCLKLPRACKNSYAFREDEVVGSYSEFYGTILFKEAACDGINCGLLNLFGLSFLLRCVMAF